MISLINDSLGCASMSPFQDGKPIKAPIGRFNNSRLDARGPEKKAPAPEVTGKIMKLTDGGRSFLKAWNAWLINYEGKLIPCRRHELRVILSRVSNDTVLRLITLAHIGERGVEAAYKDTVLAARKLMTVRTAEDLIFEYNIRFESHVLAGLKLAVYRKTEKRLLEKF